MVALMSEVQKPALQFYHWHMCLLIWSTLMKTNPCESSSWIWFMEKVFYTVSEGVFYSSDQMERDQTTLVVQYYYSLLNK